MKQAVFVCIGRAQQAEASWGRKKNESEGEEREIREEESAAHGKHMYYMNSASAEMDRGKGAGDVGWEKEARGRGVKKRRSDPVRSAAAP